MGVFGNTFGEVFAHNGSLVNPDKTWFESVFDGIPIKYPNGTMKIRANNADVPSYSRVVLRLNGLYHSFYESFEVVDGVSRWCIRKRVSIDGVTYSDVSGILLAHGASGEYDELGQADPTVIYDGVGDWKMWYDAKKVGTIYNEWDKLAYATSPDGTTWTKVGIVISRGESGAWDDGMVHHPATIKHNGVYYMFYAGGHDSGSSYYLHIGVATSVDGINFTKHANNPVLSPGASGEWDDAYIRPSCPVLIFGKWYMWYWGYGANDASDHHMGLATSTDLIHWTKQGLKLSRDAATDGVTASYPELRIGGNPRDIIIKSWYCTAAEQKNRFCNIAIPTTKTRLGVFSPNNYYPDLFTANYLYFSRITVGSTITPSSLKVFLSAYLKPVTGTCKLAIYANGSNTPTSLICSSNEKSWVDISGAAWTDFVFATPPTLTAADYWVCFQSTVNYYKNKFAGGANNWGNKAQAYGDFPATAGATTTQAFVGNSFSFTGIANYNIYRITLNTEPSKIYFNGIQGNKQTSIALVDSEYDWYWAANVLYIFSDENPSIIYQMAYE